MKYYECKDANIKAQVALRAIKGESIRYLSRRYHVNPKEIVRLKLQLAEQLYVEDWMVDFFTKQPYFLENKWPVIESEAY